MRKSNIIIFITLFINNIICNDNPTKHKKIILWDLGHVLVKPNQTKMGLQYILPKTFGFNPWNIIRLAILYKNKCLTPKSIQDNMDFILDHARAHEEKQTKIINQHGIPHANIDCDHSNGIISDKQLFAEIQQSIKKIEEEDKLKKPFEKFFKNPVHKYLIESSFAMRFIEPKFFGECFISIPEGVELLEKCANNPNNEMAILSNWGYESFPHMLAFKPNQIIFKHFKPEHIFASGIIKKSKPYPEAYQHAIDSMQAEPKDFIFIDDQILNVEAARAIGMNAIHLTNYKDPAAYKAVEQELTRLGGL